MTLGRGGSGPSVDDLRGDPKIGMDLPYCGVCDEDLRPTEDRILYKVITYQDEDGGRRPKRLYAHRRCVNE